MHVLMNYIIDEQKILNSKINDQNGKIYQNLLQNYFFRMFNQRSKKPRELPHHNADVLEKYEEQIKKEGLFTYKTKQATNFLRQIHKQASKFKDQGRFQTAKKYFDIYYEGTLKAMIQRCQQSYLDYFELNKQVNGCQTIVEEIKKKLQSQQRNLFPEATDMTLSNLLGFKNQFNHLQLSQIWSKISIPKNNKNKKKKQQQSIPKEKWKEMILLPKQTVKKMLIPNILNARVKLISKKVYFYKSLGYQNLISSAEKLLALQNKSSLALPLEPVQSRIQSAIESKKNGNIKQAINILKQQLNKTHQSKIQNTLFPLHKILIKYLRIAKGNPCDILTILDKCLHLANLDIDKSQILNERRLVIMKASKMIQQENYNGMIKYFEEKTKRPQKAPSMRVLQEYMTFLRLIQDKKELIKLCSMASEAIHPDQTYEKAQFIKQKGCLYIDQGRVQDGLNCLYKAQTFHKISNNQKIRFYWKCKMFQKIYQTISTSKDPSQLKTIAFLYKKQGDRLRQQNIQYTKMRQYYRQSVKVMDTAIRLLNDYSTIKKYLDQQTIYLCCFLNVSADNSLIVQYQKKILKQMNIAMEYGEISYYLNSSYQYYYKRQTKVSIQKQLEYNEEKFIKEYQKKITQFNQIKRQQQYIKILKFFQSYKCKQKQLMTYQKLYNILDSAHSLDKNEENLFEQIFKNSPKQVNKKKVMLKDFISEIIKKRKEIKQEVDKNYEKFIKENDREIKEEIAPQIVQLVAKDQCLTKRFGLKSVPISNAIKFFDPNQQSLIVNYPTCNFIRKNKLLQKNYQKNFSLKDMLQQFQQWQINMFLAQNIIQTLIPKLWKKGRQLQAYNLYKRSVFLNQQNLQIHQYEQSELLSKIYQIQKQYKLKDYKQCLRYIKQITKQKSIQNLIKIPHTKTKQLQFLCQKYEILSLWHQGHYRLACKLYVDMIFYSGKDIQTFLNASEKHQQQGDFKLIKKYNTILFNGNNKNFTKCVQDMKKLQKQIIEKNRKIKDIRFYENYLVFLEKEVEQMIEENKKKDAKRQEQAKKRLEQINLKKQELLLRLKGEGKKEEFQKRVSQKQKTLSVKLQDQKILILQNKDNQQKQTNKQSQIKRLSAKEIITGQSNKKIPQQQIAQYQKTQQQIVQHLSQQITQQLIQPITQATTEQPKTQQQTAQQARIKLLSLKINNFTQIKLIFQQKINKLFVVEKKSQLYKIYANSITTLVDIFFNQVYNMRKELERMKGEYFTNDGENIDNMINYDSIQVNFNIMNEQIKNCQKIKNMNLIQSTRKIEQFNYLKQCWNQTCFVIYKEVINKGMQSNKYVELKNLIENLKQQFMMFEQKNERQNVDGNGKDVVEAEYIQKLPEIAKEVYQSKKNQLQALVSKGIEKSKKQMNQAYEKIKLQLSKTKIPDNQSQSAVIDQLVKDNLEMKQQNQFFMDLIQNLQNKIAQRRKAKQQESQKQLSNKSSILSKSSLIQQRSSLKKLSINQFKASKTKSTAQQTIDLKSLMLKQLQEVKSNKQSQMQQKINKAKEQMEQAFRVLRANMQRIASNPPENMNSDDLIKELVNGHQEMKDQNQFFNDMIQEIFEKKETMSNKLQSLEELIRGLQNVQQNTTSVHNVQQLIRNYMHSQSNKQISFQTKQSIQTMKKFITQNVSKQTVIQTKLLDYINKNILKLFEYIKNILDPDFDKHIQKKFKRFNDDLFDRDNKLNDIQRILDNLVLQKGREKQEIDQQLEHEIEALKEQYAFLKEIQEDVDGEITKGVKKYNNKCSWQDFYKLKNQLVNSYDQLGQIGKLIGNFNRDQLRDDFKNLMGGVKTVNDLVAKNDYNLQKLCQKMGVDIVITFHQIKKQQPLFKSRWRKMAQLAQSRMMQEQQLKQENKQNKQNILHVPVVQKQRNFSKTSTSSNKRAAQVYRDEVSKKKTSPFAPANRSLSKKATDKLKLTQQTSNKPLFKQNSLSQLKKIGKKKFRVQQRQIQFTSKNS